MQSMKQWVFEIAVCVIIVGVVSAQSWQEDSVSEHYSVARELKLFTDLDLSAYAEDLQCQMVEGRETKIMVRFEIQRDKYADLVKINEMTLGRLEGVSSKVFKNRLAEHRKTLPDKKWFWELLEHDGPFFAGKTLGDGGACDVFAVLANEEILRVILVCQSRNRVELGAKILLYTGLELPTGAENIKFEVVRHDEPYYQCKTAFVRLELGDEQAEEIAGSLTNAMRCRLDAMYRIVTPRDQTPEWWKVEEAERFDIDIGKETRYRYLSSSRVRNAYILPIPSGGQRIYMEVDIRLVTHRRGIESLVGMKLPESASNCRYRSKDVMGSGICWGYFEISRVELVKLLNTSETLPSASALGPDEGSRYVITNAPKGSDSIKDWWKPMSLAEQRYAAKGLSGGMAVMNICVGEIQGDMMGVYLVYNYG